LKKRKGNPWGQIAFLWIFFMCLFVSEKDILFFILLSFLVSERIFFILFSIRKDIFYLFFIRNGYFLSFLYPKRISFLSFLSFLDILFILFILFGYPFYPFYPFWISIYPFWICIYPFIFFGYFFWFINYYRDKWYMKCSSRIIIKLCGQDVSRVRGFFCS
jgi:hypothetical protein